MVVASKQIFLVEFSEQIREIKEKNLLDGDSICIAFNPVIHDALEKESMPVVDVRTLFSEKEIWSDYPAHNNLSFILTKKIDSLTGSDLFDSLHYIFKISVDQVHLYITIIAAVIHKYHPEVIYSSALNKIHVNEDGLIRSDLSLISLIVQEIAKQYHFTHYQFNELPHSIMDISNLVSFGQPTYLFSKLKRRVKGLIRKITQFIAEPLVNKLDKNVKRVISVECDDLNYISPCLKKENIQVLKFEYYDQSLVTNFTLFSHDKIINELQRDATLVGALTYKGVSILKILSPQIQSILSNLGKVSSLYSKVAEFVDKVNPEAVFVRSLTCFYLPNILFHKICEEKNIPLICWMHGGYGGYYSLPGYDVTDYRLTRNHIVYGEAAIEAVNSNRSIMKKLNYYESYYFLACGSPYREALYQGYTRPCHEKKVVVLTISATPVYNSYYYGLHYEDGLFNNLEAHIEIIRCLMKFSDRYTIIVKDYPVNNMRSVWESLLSEMPGNDIKIITKEQSYSEVIKSADLLIYTWVSTSFIEGLLTDADIFLFDRGPVTSGLEKRLKQICYSDSVSVVCEELEKYLEKGDFYQQERNELKNYFITQLPNDEKAKRIKHYLENIQ